MKTNAFLLISICIIMGCSNQDRYSDSLNITAPNGEKIAKNLVELNDIISDAAEIVFGESKDIKIDNISYYNVKIGFMAKIQYNTLDNFHGSAIVTNQPSLNDSTIKYYKSRTEGGSGSIYIYTCKNTDSHKCPSCEVVRTTTGEIKCFCSSGDRSVCELRIHNR